MPVRDKHSSSLRAFLNNGKSLRAPPYKVLFVVQLFAIFLSFGQKFKYEGDATNNFGTCFVQIRVIS
jgi:hypothetical protein